jgi:outer membrane receptor protein involved in Fe transport
MKSKFSLFPLLFALLSLSTDMAGQESTSISIRAVDSQGAGISADSLRISKGSSRVECSPEFDGLSCRGEFSNDDILTVRADGFEFYRITVSELRSRGGKIELVRSLQAFEVEIYGDGQRTRLSPLGLSQVSLKSADLRETASPVLDDGLRQVAGFSTFRRTSGRQSNPTTQGVSLRGVGSTGASRTAVVEDGVSLNDPFGGWVQWNRVIQPLITEVEVLRGGASGLYGSSALSGAIIIRPLDRRDGRFSAELFGGSQNTIGANGRLAEMFKGSLLTGGFSSLRTRGYIPIDESARGTVDSFAGVRYDSFQARYAGKLNEGLHILFKPSIFGEVRTNGTGVQTNRTHSKSLIAGVSYISEPLQISARVNGINQVYDQMFSTVAAIRNSESLNRVQRVPVRSLGYSVNSVLTVSRDFFNALNIGVESRVLRGASDEVSFVNGIPNTRTGVGGSQRFTSLFMNNRFAKNRLVMNISVRGDFIGNRNGISVSTPVSTNTTTSTSFADRDYSSLSGRAGVSYQSTSRINIFASASTSFRAPTLNELYRGFRVGSVLTLPNENLLPERGVEMDLGIIYSTKKLGLRTAYFRNDISDTVSNVTVSSSPSLITRQRRNVGRTLSQGIELDVEGRINDSLALSAGYLFTDSTVREFPANTSLVGLRIPQVARHQATLQTRFAGGGILWTMQLRASAPQFDDDLNLFRLEGFLQMDSFVSYAISERLKVFGGMENIFNRRYSTARTPIRSVGPPIGARIGMRWN